MKFFRYKQVARLNFSGIDDELNDVDSSYYNTKQKLFDNDEINTKLLRFRINNLRDLQSRQQRVVSTNTTTLAGAINTYNNNIEIRNAYDNGITFFNPSPDKLYNFTISNTFTNNTVFEFEIIYEMDNGINIVPVDDNTEFYKFQCSFIICDVDEEELISNDSNTVDLSKFKPHFPLKKSH